MSDVVLTQDISSGRVHKRVSATPTNPAYGTNALLMSHEADNLDDAGEFRVLPDIGHAQQPMSLCQRCFPPEAVLEATAAEDDATAGQEDPVA